MTKLDHSKKNVGKVVTGVLIGSVVGATIGWLTAPASGAETRRRLTGRGSGGQRSEREGASRAVWEKVKTSEGNVESVVRELEEETDESPREAKKNAARRGKERLPLD